MSQDNKLSNATSKLSLNPQASEWKPSFTAREFVPGSFSIPAPAPAATPQAAPAPAAPVAAPPGK